MMKTVLTVLMGWLLLGLSACGDLPPGKVPFSTTSEQGGGDGFFNHYRYVGQ